MNIWHVYDYLVHVVHKYMMDNEQCLYNALVLTLPNQSTETLLSIRDSMDSISRMIEDELQKRIQENEQ